jgi:hypothetical protein
MRRDHRRDAEDDHGQRSGTPPTLPQSAHAVAALEPGPEDAKHHERRAQHLGNVLHNHSSSPAEAPDRWSCARTGLPSRRR